MLRRLILALSLLSVPAFTIAADPPARTDAAGDPLPEGAIARLGTLHFREGYYIQSAALSPDGKLVAIAGGAQVIRLREVATGKEVRQIRAEQFGVNYLTFTPDGKALAVRGYNNKVQLFEVGTGNQTASFDMGDRNNFRNGPFLFSADGKTVVPSTEGYPGTQNKATVSAWKIDGKQIGPFEVVHNYDIRTTISGDGKVMASWGRYLSRGAPNDPKAEMEKNQTIHLWDLANSKELGKIQADGGYQVSGVALSPDGKTLATSSGGATITFWETATGKAIRRVAGRRSQGGTLLFSPDGKTLAQVSPTGMVQMWESATGKRLGVTESSFRTRFVGIAFPEPGKAVALGIEGQSIVIWEIPSGKYLTPRDGHLGSVHGIVFAGDGKSILTAGTDGRIIAWDREGKELRQVELKEDEDLRRLSYSYPSFLFSPDGRYSLSNHPNGGVRLWELATGKGLCDFDSPSPGGGAPQSATFSHDGNLLALGGNATQPGVVTPVRVWDVSTGQAVSQMKGAEGNMRSASFSPDGKLLLTAHEYYDRAGMAGQITELHVWDVATGKAVSEHKVERLPSPWASFAPDSKTVLIAGQDQIVRFLDAVTMKEQRQLQGNVGFPTLPPVFAPDGRSIAIAANVPDPMGGPSRVRVRIWEVASGQMRAEFTGHEGTISALAFSPDGKVLASGGQDTTVLLWDLAGRLGGDSPKALAEKEQQDLWLALDETDAKKAFKAIQNLCAVPADGVAVMTKNLHPAEGKGTGPDEIAKLIKQLDADAFADREKATDELMKIGKVAEEPLRKALKNGPSAEMKRRIEDLLERLQPVGPSRELVRPLRALEVLERIGTPEARQVLEALAKGTSDAELTIEAKRTLERLAKRTGAKP